MWQVCPGLDMKEQMEPPDETEFARQVTLYRRQLMRYAIRRLDDLESAEDLVADAFVVLWRRWHEAPTDEQRVPWLFGVANGLIRNTHRAGRRQNRLHARLAGERELEEPAPRFTSEAVRQLDEAMGGLSAGDREAIQLHYWDQLSQRDIGVVLGCSENAVAHRLSRARRVLLDQLAEPTSSKPAARNDDKKRYTP